MADVIEITIPNGITYSLKDATAVKFVEQSLTDAQKAQARKNIGAGAADKLVLGQVCGIIPGSAENTETFGFGFKELFGTNTTTTITFSNYPAASWSFGNKYRICKLGDFVAIPNNDTADTVTIKPIAGKTEGFPRTGEWIRVKSGYYMFNGCSSVKSLDLSMFDTSEVRDMNNMFYGCSALETLDISSFDMSNVTSYTGMFLTPPSVLTTLKTPKINPITDIVLPRKMYAQDGTAYNYLPVTTGTSIELRRSWT